MMNLFSVLCYTIYKPNGFFITWVSKYVGAAIPAATGAQGKIQEFLAAEMFSFCTSLNSLEPEHNSKEMRDWPYRSQNKALGLNAFPSLSDTPSLVPRDPSTQLSDKSTF